MSSPSVVLDASAVLCLLLSEPGSDKVEALIDGAVMTAVNYAEVVGKLIDRGLTADEVVSDLFDLGIAVVEVDRALAEIAARMRSVTGQAGLSLGDRICLALAIRLSVAAVTTDRAWGKVASPLGVTVDVVR